MTFPFTFNENIRRQRNLSNNNWINEEAVNYKNESRNEIAQDLCFSNFIKESIKQM